eukprot:350197-Chlamydomonas_euryale.AAC.4
MKGAGGVQQWMGLWVDNVDGFVCVGFVCVCGGGLDGVKQPAAVVAQLRAPAGPTHVQCHAAWLKNLWQLACCSWRVADGVSRAAIQKA